MPERTARTWDAAEALARVVQLRRRDRWTRERVERHQAERRAAQVRFAMSRSPFYRRHYRAAGVGTDTPLSGLPPVDKRTIMAEFDDVVTDRRLKLGELEAHLAGLDGDELYLGAYRVIATGGTSGVRGVFAYDRREWTRIVASAVRTGRFMDLRGRRGHRLRTASVTAASPVHWGGRYARTSGLGVSVPLELDARTPVPLLVERLNRHRPDLLACYPSVAGLLALEQLAGRLQIRPRAVATSGEPRSEELCHTMRRAWGDVLFDGYATTEAGFCGMECTEHRGIHLLEDQTIFEVVDDDYRPVPAGVEGRRLLVTSLFNRTIPLLRYELSDMVTVSDARCACGRPWRLAMAIAGRREDMLRFATADGHALDVHPTALTGAIERTVGVREFQVVHDRDALTVSIVPRAGSDAAELARRLSADLGNVLTELGAARCPVRVETVAGIERRGIAGKVKLVEERTAPDEPDPRRSRVAA